MAEVEIKEVGVHIHSFEHEISSDTYHLPIVILILQNNGEKTEHDKDIPQIKKDEKTPLGTLRH